MTRLSAPAQATYVQNIFTLIARGYDFMNRLMTGRQDIRWRKRVIELAGLRPYSCLLDLGTGTGDLAQEALVYSPEAPVIAADFTLEMMSVGRNKCALNFSAYRYLPESMEGFVTAEEVASPMTAVGFEKVDFQRLMFGTIAIHLGGKPSFV
jgi:ubiquinone/menaquinone biosynthesis C-methylase UbiE